MKNLNIIFSVLLLSALTAFAVTKILTGQADSGESTFDRVMRTGTLRCGYYAYAPITVKDPLTGELSGLSVDIMEAIAAKTSLRIEWAEEITFANWIPALQTGRIDAVCTPLWADASYARIATFTLPLFYDAVLPLVRADEARFGHKTEDLDNEAITIAYQADNMVEKLIQAHFPKARTLVLPDTSDYGLLMQNVVAGKADVALWDLAGFGLYNRNNPGKMKVLELDKLLRLIPCALPVLNKEQELLALLNAGLNDLLLSGQLDKIIDKWETDGPLWLRAAKPAIQGTQK